MIRNRWHGYGSECVYRIAIVVFIVAVTAMITASFLM
jgi:hypothetical protein